MCRLTSSSASSRSWPTRRSHTYQILTKRSKRLASLADKLDWAPNVWMGVSVESEHYAFRIDHLRSVPAAARFISAEPLLEALPNLDLSSIHWLIAGGESGHNARPMKEEWALDLRDQCAAADVAFFFKQWGGRTPKAGGRQLDGSFHNDMPAPAFQPINGTSVHMSGRGRTA